MAMTSWPTFLKERRRGSRLKMAALIKTLARKQIRRGEKLIKARNIGFQKHTLWHWYGPDYRAHRIHTPQAYWLRRCLICFPQPTRSTLEFTGEGNERKREGTVAIRRWKPRRIHPFQKQCAGQSVSHG